MGAFWGMVKLWIKFTKVELKSAVGMKAHNGVLQREKNSNSVYILGKQGDQCVLHVLGIGFLFFLNA